MKKSLLIAAFAGSLLAATAASVAPSMAQSAGCDADQMNGNTRNPRPCPQQPDWRQGQQRQDWRNQDDWRARQQRDAAEQQRRQQEEMRRQQDEARRQEDWRRQQDQARRQDEWRRQQEEARRQEEWRRRREPEIVVAPPVYVQPPVVYNNSPVYSGGRWVPCARENGVCDVPYSTRVRFGRRGHFAYLDVDGPIRCSNSNFGDPIRGVPKRCDYLAD